MTERPKPPRPDAFPPPLPGAFSEPFPKAKSDPPDPLHMTPAPEAHRMRSTPPSGSLMLARQMERLSEDPKDEMIRELRQTIVLYRERLTALQTNTAPSLVPEAPKSRAVAASKAALNVGKYTAVVIGVLGLAMQVAAIWRPDLVGPLQSLLRLFWVP